MILYATFTALGFLALAVELCAALTLIRLRRDIAAHDGESGGDR